MSSSLWCLDYSYINVVGCLGVLTNLYLIWTDVIEGLRLQFFFSRFEIPPGSMISSKL